MILIIDTETTGLGVFNQPRLVQIAWAKYDYNKNLIDYLDVIIKPDEFIIPKQASDIHGITTEKAYSEGKSIIIVLTDFISTVRNVQYIVGHNLIYDLDVIHSELKRHNFNDPCVGIEKLCLMRATTNFCAIPNKLGFKWPTLNELYFKLFNSEFTENHNAKYDVIATAKCFWELKQKNIISIEEANHLSKLQYLSVYLNEIKCIERDEILIAIPCGDYDIISREVLDGYGKRVKLNEAIFEINKEQNVHPLFINGQPDETSDLLISKIVVVFDYTTSSGFTFHQGESFVIGVLA